MVDPFLLHQAICFEVESTVRILSCVCRADPQAAFHSSVGRVRPTRHKTMSVGGLQPPSRGLRAHFGTVPIHPEATRLEGTFALSAGFRNMLRPANILCVLVVASLDFVPGSVIAVEPAAARPSPITADIVLRGEH